MKPSMRGRYPLIRQDNILSEELTGEFVVYDCRNNRAHQLNSTLSWIWQRCDGSHSVDDIAAAFQNEFDVTDARGIVDDGLRQLNACEILEPRSLGVLQSGSTPGISRRSWVTASTVLWPAAISLIAPEPAEARSRPAEETTKPTGSARPTPLERLIKAILDLLKGR